MELLDHIATEIQLKINCGQSFDNALEESHEAFGNKLESKKLSKDQKNWIFTESIYGDNSGYKFLIREKHKKLTSTLYGELWKNLKRFFMNPVTLVIYFALILILIKLNVWIEDEETFARLVVIPLLVLSIIPYIWAYFKFKKSFSSLYLSSLSLFPLLSVSLFNLFLTGPRIFIFGQDKPYSFGYMMFLFCILFPLIFVGLKTFYNWFSAYHNIYKRLLT